MSTALGISAVTAVLEYLFNVVYNDPGTGLGSVTVSAKAPDILQTSFGNGSAPPLQVNLFLHQVTLNAAWRNVGLPSLAADGTTRLQNPPLALDLHYLLTVYASEDCQAEALLGFGVQILNETAILSRDQIRYALTHLPPSIPLAGLLAVSGLADQIETIKISPATLGREEVAWLWTALKADYRPTFPFQASVVLIQSPKPLVASLPVLQRMISAQPNLASPFATVTEIDAPLNQPAALLGDTLTVRGRALAGATSVIISNSRLGVQNTITTLLNISDDSFQFALNVPPAQLPPGVYSLAAQVSVPPDTLNTNALPLAVAPKIITAPASVSHGNVTVNITCSPQIWPDQEVLLLIGGVAATATPSLTPTGSLSFAFSSIQPTGAPVPLRLRVDGVESPVIDMTVKPPVFSGPLITVT